ncbi:MAG: DUF2125 domain-containing protein, partial [Pseudomonadota bacterium]
FPFRLDLDLADARLRGRSGWILAAPRLEAEAFVFSPGHWVAVAPEGVTFIRRSGGPVAVKARVLRASLSDAGARPPRLSIEGEGLTFAAPPGAEPFFVTAAREFHLHTRPGPGDRGAVFVELKQASVRLSGLMGRIAAGKPVGLAADAVYSHAGALAGEDWPSAVRAWTSAGGALFVRRIEVDAGDAVLDARAGTLTVGPDGRLQGSLTATLRQAQRALAAMGEAGAIAPEAAGAAAMVVGARGQGSLATVTLDFQAGRTTLGPAAIGPAPKVY